MLISALAIGRRLMALLEVSRISQTSCDLVLLDGNGGEARWFTKADISIFPTVPGFGIQRRSGRERQRS